MTTQTEVRPRCPEHDLPDCSPLLNGCSRLIVAATSDETSRQRLVLGVDLSLTATGMSDGDSTWLVRSSGHKGDLLITRSARLRGLATQVVQRCTGADLVVLEQPAFSRTTGHMHDRSGLWWLVVDALTYELQVPLVEVSPTALKKFATGKGNANKGAVIDATARRFPDVDTGADDNRCDALWLAAMGRVHLGEVSPVPAAQYAVLANVAWPAPVAL